MRVKWKGSTDGWRTRFECQYFHRWEREFKAHLNIVPVNQTPDLLVDCEIGASAEFVGWKPGPYSMTLSPSLDNPGHTMVRQLFEQSVVESHCDIRWPTSMGEDEAVLWELAAKLLRERNNPLLHRRVKLNCISRSTRQSPQPFRRPHW